MNTITYDNLIENINKTLEYLPFPPPDIINKIYYHPDDRDIFMDLALAHPSVQPVISLFGIPVIESSAIPRGTAIMIGPKDKIYLVNLTETRRRPADDRATVEEKETDDCRPAPCGPRMPH